VSDPLRLKHPNSARLLSRHSEGERKKKHLLEKEKKGEMKNEPTSSFPASHVDALASPDEDVEKKKRGRRKHREKKKKKKRRNRNGGHHKPSLANIFAT